ncbi:MAG: hypothetical protein WC867_03420 [Candidatus Pacearchaeota archaeon]|jgi:hypothetical protein
MIGKCPSCGISLITPPFNGRNTNEVLLTLAYRRIVETNTILRSIDELGYCELCDAKLKDLEEQGLTLHI